MNKLKKRCSKCQKNKSVDLFYRNKNTRDGYHHYCKDCHSVNGKKRYAENPGRRYSMKANNLRVKYNLTPDDLTNMSDVQHDCCAICNNKFQSERQTFIDHDHMTGEVRGLLCPKCNNVLGNCGDSIEILKAAILYLQKKTPGVTTSGGNLTNH